VDRFFHQIVAVCASMAYAFIVTLVSVKVIDMTIGMTVKDEEEYVGLDISQHWERAYT
jgi:ammonium transporter, Amt family